MKVTIDIADPLFDEAGRLAAQEGITPEVLIEMGLRRGIAQARRDGAFKLRRASFAGNGLRPGLEGASWKRLRDLADRYGTR